MKQNCIGLVLSAVPGYSETFFRNKIKGLQAAGHKVVLFVQTNDPSFDLCPILVAPKVHKKYPIFQVLSMGFVIFKLMLKPRRCAKYYTLERAANRSWSQLFKNIYNNSHILSANTDWLHFGFATLALQSEHVAKAINAKMAVSIRGFDIGIFPIKEPNCYKLLWNQLDKLHSISYDLLDLAYLEGLNRNTPYQIITPAIDTNMFSSKKLNRIDNEVIRFICIARLHWKKGLVYTFEALSILKEKGIAFEFVLIGSGEEYERLVFAADQLGILENIVFKGKLSHKDVQLELTKSNIYLQYSIQEGFCNAVLEAQSMGLLCIVSDAEGLQENVKHDQTGWVVPKRSPQLLANKIIEVLDLPVIEQNKISERAISHVQSEFNIQKQQQEFVDFYNN